MANDAHCAGLKIRARMWENTMEKVSIKNVVILEEDSGYAKFCIDGEIHVTQNSGSPDGECWPTCWTIEKCDCASMAQDVEVPVRVAEAIEQFKVDGIAVEIE